MLDNVIKYIIRAVAWKAKKKILYQILVSRCRRDGHPESGRFTKKEIDRIAAHTENHIQQLRPYLNDSLNAGNYQNQYVGMVDLAIYRALRSEGIAANYASLLVADMMWQAVVNSKGIVPIVDPIRKLYLRHFVRDPHTILHRRLKSMMKYPYSPPGYQIEFYEKEDVFCMDIYTCPVYEFYKQFSDEEMDLFRKAWCTFDITAGENVVEGGKYERKHTLSSGDNVCDMRWFITK